jgi:hypothetical protein
VIGVVLGLEGETARLLYSVQNQSHGWRKRVANRGFPSRIGSVL